MSQVTLSPSASPTLSLLQQRVDEAIIDLASTREELRRRVELKRQRDARFRARKRARGAGPPRTPRRVFTVDRFGVADLD
jgi:hypothetical protein